MTVRKAGLEERRLDSSGDWIEDDDGVSQSKLKSVIQRIMRRPENVVKYEYDPKELERIERLSKGDVGREETISSFLGRRTDKREALREKAAKLAKTKK